VYVHLIFNEETDKSEEMLIEKFVTHYSVS